MNHSKFKGILALTILFTFTISSFFEPVFILKSIHSSNKSSSSVELIDAVNSLRISNGLPAYQVNQILMFVAQSHSNYQASIGTTTHFGPDGSRPFQRALSAGYIVAGDLSLGGYFSENIIAGNNISASDAVRAWQLDAPYLNTMLSYSLQDIGAGVTVIGDLIYYTIDVGLSTTGSPVTTQEIGILPTYKPYSEKKILTSTPDIDGAIYHIVEIGDTIWSISQAYEISEEELVQLNSLTDNLIYVGDKFLISPPYTPTPTILESTASQIASITPSPSQTIQPQITKTKNPTVDVSDQKPAKQDNVILGLIISVTLLASGLFTFIGRKKTNK